MKFEILLMQLHGVYRAQTRLVKPLQLLDVTLVGCPTFATVEKEAQDYCCVDCTFRVQLYAMVFP